MDRKERIRLGPMVELTILPLRAHRNHCLTYISCGEAADTVLRSGSFTTRQALPRTAEREAEMLFR